MTELPAGVREVEDAAIRARRDACGVADYHEGPRPTNLFGVALSGGGIRAASFAMGALRALEQQDVLRHVDYLSSVSGGGFASAALLTTSRTSPTAGLDDKALAYVRGRASYLAPHGLFSRSGVAMIVTYAFGLVLNLIYYLALIGIGMAAALYAMAAPNHIARVVSFVSIAVAAVAVGRLLFKRAPVRAPDSKQLVSRARERGLLAAFAVVVAVFGGYLGLRELMHSVWSGYFSPRLDARLGTSHTPIAVVGAALVTVVPALAKRVFDALHDATVIKRYGGTLVQLLAVLVLLLAAAFHVVLDFEIRYWLQVTFAHPFDFGLGLQPWLAAAGDAALVLGAGSGVVFLAAWWIRWRMDWLVSLHYFFRDRIAEAFVLRRTDTADGLATDADLTLAALGQATGAPYPVFNATMNLDGDGSLHVDELRHAAAFELTPAYCGFKDKYCKTPDWGPAGGLTVATAAAVSAAAVAPHMGLYSRGLLSVLVTALNLRLGVDLPNPAGPDAGVRRGPRRPHPGRDRYTADAAACYLSDGGHFDNLGIYALLRRRCRYILAIDAEADGDFTLAGLGTVSRFAEADLGCTLDLDTSALRPDEHGCSRAAFAVGTATWSDFTATIIYLKSSYLEGLAPDLVAYRAKHPGFPHESTANQFFDEAQFEAYYRLGFDLVTRMLRAANHRPAADFSGLASLFSRLSAALAPWTADQAESFQRTTEQLMALEALAADGKASLAYDQQLYPEALRLLLDPASRTDFHFIVGQIQLMEQVFQAGQLDDGGWQRLFERYAASARFREVWTAVGDIFGADFHRFCEERFHLPPPPRARATDVVVPSVPLLRGSNTLTWRYAPPAGTFVLYEVAIDRRGPTGRWQRYREEERATPWCPVDRELDGEIRICVRARARDSRRELAVGEQAGTTYFDSLARIAATNTLRVGVYVDPAGSPFCYSRTDGELAGFDVELAKALAADLGAAHTVCVPFAWPAILEAPAQHVIDLVIASITPTEERARTYGLRFSAAYEQTRTALLHAERLALPAFPDWTTQSEALAKLRLGALRGSFAASQLRRLAEQRTLAHAPVFAPDNVELASLVTRGQLDAVFADADRGPLLGVSLVEHRLHPAPDTQEQTYAVGAAEVNVDLLAKVDASLARMRATGWTEKTLRDTRAVFAATYSS